MLVPNPPTPQGAFSVVNECTEKTSHTALAVKIMFKANSHYHRTQVGRQQPDARLYQHASSLCVLMAPVVAGIQCWQPLYGCVLCRCWRRWTY